MTDPIVELDVRGEMCPYPALKTKEALGKLRGDALRILTDHAPALSTVPWEGARAGFDADIAVAAPGEWAITLIRHGGAFDKQAALTRIGEQLRGLGHG
jgi:hypothetical protein